MSQKTVISLLLILFNCLNPFTGFSQLNKIRQLQSDLPLTKDSISYVNKLNRLSTLYSERNTDSSKYYAIRAQQIATRIDYTSGIACALNNLGMSYTGSDQHQAAIYLHRSLRIFESLKDIENTCMLLNNIGSSYALQGDIKSALQYIYQAYDQSKSLKKDSIRSAIICLYLFYDRSISEPVFEQLASKGKDIAEKYKDTVMSMYFDRIFIQKLYLKGEKDKAKKMYSQLLEKANQHGCERLKIVIYYELAHLLLGDKQEAKGILYMEKAFESSKKNDFPMFFLTLAAQLHQYYKSKNQIEKASYYAELTIDRLSQLLVLSARPGVNHNGHVLQEEVIQNLETAERLKKNILILLGSLLAVISALLFYVNRSLKIKQKFNEAQSQLNAITTQQNEDLEHQNNFNTMLISVVAHDIRQPFSSIMMLSSIYNEKVNLLPEQKKIQIMQELHQVSKRSIDFMDGLLEWIKSQKSNFKYNAQELDLNTLVTEANIFFDFAQINKKIKFVSNIPEHTTIIAHRQMLLFILRNILSNATKLSPAKGIISVTATIEEKYLIISIEDNGIGMSQQQLNDLFQVKSNLNDLTRNDGAGIAMNISFEMATIMGADIYATSKQEMGTTFHVKLKRALA